MGWFHRLLGSGIPGNGVCLLVCEAGPKARAGLLLVRPSSSKSLGGDHLLMGEVGPKARTGSLLGGAGDSGAGACPLVGGVGNQGLWLEGPGGPGYSACALVCGAWS